MDISQYFRFLLALVFVLALIGLLAYLAKRAGFGYPVNLSRNTANRRIQVVETAPVDGRRRLVLVRRDNVEHLLVIGQNSETVIETNIQVPDRVKMLNDQGKGFNNGEAENQLHNNDGQSEPK